MRNAARSLDAGGLTLGAGTGPLTGPLTGLVAAWNRFWFNPADPTALGFIRICCGLLTLYVHLIYSFDLQQYFGKDAWMDLRAADERRKEGPTLDLPWGWEDEQQQTLPADPDRRLQVLEAIVPELRVKMDEMKIDPSDLPRDGFKRRQLLETVYAEFVNEYNVDPLTLGKESREQKQYILDYGKKYGADPRRVADKGHSVWSVWYHVTDPFWMAVVHGGILLVMLLFTVGFCTRVTSVLTWLGAVSYIQRSPATLFGQDTMMNLLLLYLMIGPSGAALSVDRLLGRWWARRRGGALADLPPPGPSVSANVAVRLMQVNFCFIYLASGLSKLQGATWWNGTAIWYTMANYSFAPVGNPMYRGFLKFLAENRPLWETLMAVGVVHTLVTEIGFPLLVWNKRTRWFMVVLAILLHTGIAVVMGLTLFSLYMLTLLLAFFPPETVGRLTGAMDEGLHRLFAGLRRSPEPAKEDLALSKS